jgi:glycosyltransferase involved in cell wall biosynthesis
MVPDMKNPMFVSAVIPTRNRPEQLLLAVRSALQQTHSELEVIVVIDGPDPKTAQALTGFNDSRLRIVQMERNVGGSDARNAGVQAARGRWIAFLDDDDEWLPHKLSGS